MITLIEFGFGTFCFIGFFLVVIALILTNTKGKDDYWFVRKWGNWKIGAVGMLGGLSFVSASRIAGQHFFPWGTISRIAGAVIFLFYLTVVWSGRISREDFPVKSK